MGRLKTMLYDLIAPAYDRINGDIDYSLWADFIDKVAKDNCKERPELVLDLGCGTGSMTLELAERGYDMTGVDISPEMLDIARDRAEAKGFSDKILWLMQDMEEFELYGTVDLTVSCLDCINHLNREGLKKCLSLVHNYLIPDGIFIFDINGKGKFERVYADNAFAFDTDTSFISWQNYYNAQRGYCDFYITVFEEEDDGRYVRLDEVQREYVYTLRVLRGMLKDAGFEFIGAYSDFGFTPAADSDERIYVVAKCKKQE